MLKVVSSPGFEGLLRNQGKTSELGAPLPSISAVTGKLNSLMLERYFPLLFAADWVSRYETQVE
jgi:hypothetical protein